MSDTPKLMQLFMVDIPPDLINLNQALKVNAGNVTHVRNLKMQLFAKITLTGISPGKQINAPNFSN